MLGKCCSSIPFWKSCGRLDIGSLPTCCFRLIHLQLCSLFHHLPPSCKLLREPVFLAAHNHRFQLRRSALRLLASSPSTFILKPRAISSLTASSIRARPATRFVTFRRRWASSEAEAKTEDEGAPISEIQPTPQEEVENAIHEDNAATAEDVAPAEPVAEFTEPAEEAEVPQSETSPVDTSAESVAEAAASSAAPAAAEAATPGRRAAAPNDPKSTVYVGNLFFDITENDLQTEFRRFGPVEKVRVMRDTRGLSKG